MKSKLLALITILLIFLSTSGCLGTQTEAAASQVAPSPMEERATEQIADASTTIVPYTDIMVQDLKEMIDNKEDVLILDVRTEAEFAQGHLTGSINIPHFQIEERYKELNVKKDNKIVVVCAGGVRSRAASEALNKLGYTNVYNVLGGLEQWYKKYGKYNYG